MIPRGRQLGKLPPKDDGRTLMLASYLGGALPPAPNAQDWHKYGPGPGSWGYLANDDNPCCTISGLGHLLQQWSVNAHRPILTPSDAAILDAYHAIAENPALGAYCIDALNYFRKTGILGPDGVHHKILAYAKIDHMDAAMVRTACVIGSGLYIGATLHSGIWGADIWDAPKPGEDLEGGHAMAVGYVGPGLLRPIGWAYPQAVSWAWWMTEVDEAYCLISEDSLDAAGRSGIHLDLDGLLADVQKVTA